jgi:thiosulfate sulfurtransferase
VKDFEILHASELSEILKRKDVILIDVRDREAYKKEHWPGAINYPFDEIGDGKFIFPKTKELIFYCEHGGGSMQLARQLGREGYRTATVVGGYEAIKKVSETYFKNG